MTSYSQIMPALNWFSHSLDGTEHRYDPLVCWALDENGYVVGLVADFDSVVEASSWASDLKWLGYHYDDGTTVFPEGRVRSEVA